MRSLPGNLITRRCRERPTEVPCPGYSGLTSHRETHTHDTLRTHAAPAGHGRCRHPRADQRVRRDAGLLRTPRGPRRRHPRRHRPADLPPHRRRQPTPRSARPPTRSASTCSPSTTSTATWRRSRRRSSSGRINNTPAGGVEFLARHLKNLRSQAAANGATPLTVAAGDLIGASPLLSAAFHDEPTIEAMNKIGLQVASVGNHEFDEGYQELLRMQRGGCLDDGPDGRTTRTPAPDPRLHGRRLPVPAANVNVRRRQAARRPVDLPAATRSRRSSGIKVGFIGMTLEGHADDRHGIRGRGAEVHRRGRRPPTRSCPSSRRRVSRRSWCCCTRASTPSDPTNYNGCSGVSGAGARHRPAPRPADRRRHLRPHPPGVQLHGRGPARAARGCSPAPRRSAGWSPTCTCCSTRRPVTSCVPRRTPQQDRHEQRGRTDADTLRTTTSSRSRSTNLIDALQDARRADRQRGHRAHRPRATPSQTVSRTAGRRRRGSPLGNLIADARRPTRRSCPTGGSRRRR